MKRADKAGTSGMSQLISAALRRQAAGAHLDAEVLGAFSENALSSTERERAMEHLAKCGDCREVLFLAQPQAAEDQTSFSASPRRAALVVRWAALAAAVVIVAGGVFLSRHELARNTDTTAKEMQVPQPLAKMADEKSNALGSKQAETAAMPMESTRAQTNEVRPALKHMTAKPQARMQFEANDEVRIAHSAPAAPPANLPVEARNELDLRDKGKRASQGASAYRTDKAKANEVPGSVAESVEVTAAPVVAVDAGGPVKKDSVAQQQAALASAGYVGGAAFMRLPPSQWSLTPAGAVQRSFDQGKTWQPVSVNNSPQKFLAVFSSGAQVWLGGTAGALYQSTDSGITWMRVTPSVSGRQLTADIVHIEFTDTQNGTVTLADGAVWQTADGGRTWAVTKK